MWNHLYVPTFQILAVCTANICRSPATETLLRHDLADEIVRGIVAVDSYGTQAIPGRSACDLSTALVNALSIPSSPEYEPTAPTLSPTDPTDPEIGPHSGSAPGPSTMTRSQPDGSGPDPRGAPPPESTHSARPVTQQSLEPADLILALDREHRSTLAKLSPGSRSKTFTLRQASLLAAYIHTTISAGELPPGARPLPAMDESNARLLWLVEEMDAARGAIAQVVEGDSSDPWHLLDVPDPHVIGYQIHAGVVELIRAETRQVSSAIQAILHN